MNDEQPLSRLDRLRIELYQLVIDKAYKKDTTASREKLLEGASSEDLNTLEVPFLVRAGVL